MKIFVKKLIFSMGIVMFALIATSGVAEALSNSGDGIWQYYREINIQENSGNTLANYQIMIELNNTNFPVESNISGIDIRFTDENDNELSYWIESWDNINNKSIIWVNVTSIPASGSATIRMWYGNPLAESASNGDATFEFFDDFEESSLDSNKWQTPYSGLQSIKEVSIANSVLSFTGNGCGGACTDWVSLRMGRNFTESEKMIIETRFRFTGGTWGSGAGLWRQNSLSPVNSSSTCSAIPQRVGIFGDDFYNTNWDMEYSDWSNYNKTIITSLTMNGPWYMSSLAKKNETLFEGMIYSDDSVLLGGNEYNVNFGNIDLTWVTTAIYSCGSRRYYYDWIIVRSYADVEPSVSVGPQQVIINGNFDTDLSGWIFEDASYAGCSVPYGDAIWDNGMARLGAHYAYGIAYLSQNFSDVRPSYFKVDYMTNGGCGGISIYLNNGSETVFSFRALRDSLVSSNSRMMAQFMNETDIYCSSISCIESSGTLEVYFNNSLVDVYLNNIFLGNFSIAQNFSVDSIRLLSANSCCDGRNDNYGYFDNISLFRSYDIYDTNPPASVTNLQNSSYASTYINWTWDNPSNADFAKVMVYINDIFQMNITSPTNHFNATGLNPNTQYIISTHTADIAGNINQTWVNETATTTKASGDFSGDGTTDAWDITYLARSISGIPGYETLSSGDVSGDGVVDAWDCTYLARAIAGVPGYSL